MKNLSKDCSYILRHGISKYALQVDKNGYVLISDLLQILWRDFEWTNIDRQTLEEMIHNSERKRHQISGNYIRAIYGHTDIENIVYQESIPPKVLYHGTTLENTDSIFENGLLKMQRKYVHLSSDKKTAYTVASRYTDNPVLLKISSLEAYNNGVKFYNANEQIWLVEYLPKQFISRI